MGWRGERGTGRTAPPPADRPLVCVVESTAPVAVLRLSGPLNLATAVEVRAALHKALAAQPSAVVVDLVGLVSADGAVLTVFAAFARSAAGWPSCPVLLSSPSPEVRAELERLRIGRLLLVYPDRAAAVAAAVDTPRPRQYATRLPPTAESAARARQMTAEACATWELPDLVDDATLIVSELVSNAVQHGAGELELLVTVRERYLHLSVSDGSPTPPRRILPDAETGEGGRGLVILDAVTVGWGSTPRPPGKVVWATLRRR